jgi:uncharacterized membrane protein YgcG
VLRDIAGGHQIACHLPDEQREQIVREEIMPLLEESTATASNGQSE